MTRLALILLLAACSVKLEAENIDFSVTVLHTNDLLASVVPTNNVADGFPYLAGALKRLSSNTTLLLDAGNFMGYNAFFKYYNGSVVASLMNSMGYKYATLGQNELFYGPNSLLRFLQISNISIICSNCVVTGPLSSYFSTYALLTMMDTTGTPRRVGLVGYSTTSLCSQSSCAAAGMVVSTSAIVPAVRHFHRTLSIGKFITHKKILDAPLQAMLGIAYY